MANIHRIQDADNDGPANNNNQGGFQFNLFNNQQAVISNPSTENFWDMLKNNICPALQLKSATCFLFVVVIIC